jgi:hypothetical protein
MNNLHERRLRGPATSNNLHETQLLKSRSQKHPQHDGLQVESYRRFLKHQRRAAEPTTIFQRVLNWFHNS